MITHILHTINFFKVRRKMKSLSILLVWFATSMAIEIREYHPDDTTVSITEGETLKLSCTPSIGWDECEFTHGSNEKPCIYSFENDRERCWNKTGKMYRKKDGSCIIEVKEMKKEYAGNWTCKMSDSNSKWSEPHVFAVEVQDPPETTTTRSVSTATQQTEFMVFSILAVTFLIVL